MLKALQDLRNWLADVNARSFNAHLFWALNLAEGTQREQIRAAFPDHAKALDDWQFANTGEEHFAALHPFTKALPNGAIIVVDPRGDILETATDQDGVWMRRDGKLEFDPGDYEGDGPVDRLARWLQLNPGVTKEEVQNQLEKPIYGVH